MISEKRLKVIKERREKLMEDPKMKAAFERAKKFFDYIENNSVKLIKI